MKDKKFMIEELEERLEFGAWVGGDGGDGAAGGNGCCHNDGCKCGDNNTGGDGGDGGNGGDGTIGVDKDKTLTPSTQLKMP